MTTETKPLPKSLHTVTVLVRVAKLIAAREQVHGLSADWEGYVEAALVALDLDEKTDTYGLAAAALKQLEA